ncbi:MAG: hypothetical protein WC378_09045 [Opitutaceae bacterium]|jgi:predicted RNase H-like nuclease (RuvC/YqgF family)
MDRFKELEAEVTRLKWRLKGLEKAHRSERWHLRLKIAEMNGLILGLQSALGEQAARLDSLEGS